MPVLKFIAKNLFVIYKKTNIFLNIVKMLHHYYIFLDVICHVSLKC